MLGDRSILSHTVHAFTGLDIISEIIVVLPASHVHEWVLADSRVRVMSGGANRQQSVYNALQQVNPQADVVLIHDGARPFVSERLIREVIREAMTGCAAIAGVPAVDTVKQADPQGWVLHTPERANLWNVQTPQGFPYKIILQAHEQAATDGITGTDDSMLVEFYKLTKVKMVLGERRNIKITTPEDLLYAEALLHT
jgi:2-C-methyl-D-erythritol 4-phosphate cytidylyltransferase